MKYKPNAVFATGGYVSAPMLITSAFLKIPSFMHDGDAIPGIVTRKFSPFAKGVSLAFEEAKKHINNSNINIFGNPIRDDFSKPDKQAARKQLGFDDDKLILLIMGGSQGAKGINNTIVELYRYLIEKYNIGIIHQTGAKNYDDVLKALDEAYPEYKENKDVIVRPYFDNSAIVMQAADIAVSRAGSLSISEMCASELPSVLVPYPHAAADHQLKNALAVERECAAICIEENDELKNNMLTALETLIQDASYRKNLQDGAKRLAKPDAKKNIVKSLVEIAS